VNEFQESRTLADLLRFQAHHRPTAPALIYNGRVTSYSELNRNASKVANGLATCGVRRHDRVGYLGKNSDLYFELLFGTAKA
jgi:acyl-CoA synthetase (AMP-forming)/AMP-acid ligase II